MEYYIVMEQSNSDTHNFVRESLGQFTYANPVVIILFIMYVIIVLLQDLVLPHFSGKLVNAIQHGKPLAKPFAIILTIIILVQALSTFNEWQDTLLYPEMQGFVRNKIINHIFEIYSSNYAEMDVAGVLMRAIKLPYTLFNFLDQLRYSLLPYLFVYIITIVYISYHDYILGGITALALLVMYTMVFTSPKSCEQSAFDTEAKANKIAEEVDDILNNMVSVYSQNQQKNEKARINAYQDVYVKEQKHLAQCVYNIKACMFPFMAIFLSLFMYRCFLLVETKQISAGRFVALFMILMYITSSMWRMINQMRDTIPRWGRISEGLTIFKNDFAEKSVLVKPAKSGESGYDRGIAFEKVFFMYPQSDKYVLKDINLVIPDNEKVAIVGRIGCGKSTLLKLIMKYYTPSHGEMYWHSMPYTSITAEQMRSHVGYVYQYPTLFKRTIIENITYGIEPGMISHDDIMSLLKSIGLENIFNNIPGGLDGNCGRKGSKLSGGQRQMVWLLRVYFKKPDILILDEPTASVDAETKVAIQKMLQVVMKDRTVIIVTHDSFLLNYVDRIVTLDNGGITSDKRITRNI